MSLLRCLAVPMALACSTAAAAAPPFTARELFRLERIADPRPSPDGQQVAFAQTHFDLETGQRNSDIWLVPAAGGEPRRLVPDPASDSRPRWSRDGSRLAFLSTRDGSPQVWTMPAAGGEARKLTSVATGVDAFEWLDERRLAVQTSVFPSCGADFACSAARLAEAKKGSSARAYDELLYRHWDNWSDGRRSHLFAIEIESGRALDLTPGEADAPPFSLGGEDWAVAPDGTELCFSRKEAGDEAWSTNADVFVVPSIGGEAQRAGAHAGYDGSCRYSPDGRLLAWRAQDRSGYESDRWQLVVRDRQTGAERNLTAGLDRQVESFVFTPDGRSIVFVIEEDGHSRALLVPSAGGTVRTVTDAATLGELSAMPDGRTMIGAEAGLTHPAELVRFSLDRPGTTRITQVNDAVLAPFALRAPESVRFEGAAGKDVQAWIVKPSDFDPAQKYPLLVLVHGGPQGAWTDGWTYRWNAQVFANAGFVVFMPNPRGSVGWGQAFTDEINGDWGGRAYEDVMKGTDFAEALPYVAKGRTAAAGASYGGYLINWIAGHTSRYRALVSHDGVFDLVSMYGSTEELWFPEWEMGGPYWKHPENYRRWNPRDSVAGFKTPMLVVHGERDYRVPVEQGLSLFTALRRQGIPSRLLLFPDENHFVLKPANSVRWYEEVLGWLGRWTKP